MKKMILMLSIVAVGAIAFQSCAKKKCVCVDNNGTTLTGMGYDGLTKSQCESVNTTMTVLGGSCTWK